MLVQEGATLRVESTGGLRERKPIHLSFSSPQKRGKQEPIYSSRGLSLGCGLRVMYQGSRKQIPSILMEYLGKFCGTVNPWWEYS